MELEIIDWNNIDSVFVEDDMYENFNAPQWVDFSAPDQQPIKDDSWFCNRDCKHPKNADDYLKLRQISKAKFLRSVSISEIFPFRDRTRRDAKLQKAEIPRIFKTKGSKSARNFNINSENKDPNLFTSPLDTNTISKRAAIKSSADKKEKMPLNDSHGSYSKQRLKSTFSVRNLAAGKEILNQITEFCSELKKLAKKGSKKGPVEKVYGEPLGQQRERVKDKERMPLLEILEKEY